MERAAIDQVRRFNRRITQRIGALDDAFLARGRPLGQARLLWEIGPDGHDVRHAMQPRQRSKWAEASAVSWEPSSAWVMRWIRPRGESISSPHSW